VYAEDQIGYQKPRGLTTWYTLDAMSIEQPDERRNHEEETGESHAPVSLAVICKRHTFFGVTSWIGR
jgi:hypothetical protein